MIGRTSGASRLNIDKCLEVLGLRGMEKFVGNRDDFVVDTLFYFEQFRDLSTGVICSVLGVPVTARAREFCSSWKRDISFCGKFRYSEL